MPASFQTATRIFRILLVLIVAIGVAWVTHSVNASVQSALPYIIVVLFAWEWHTPLDDPLSTASEARTD